MGKGQGRQILILLCELCKLRNHIHQLSSYNLQRLRHHDDIRIIPYVAGSRPQMDDSLRLRALPAIGIHMGHDVMADDFLPLPGHIIINILRMAFQFLDLLLRNRKPQFLFRLRKRNPQFPPRPELLVR